MGEDGHQWRSAYRELQRDHERLKGLQQTLLDQERAHVLRQMASGITHDINNAISPIALYTESLLQRETNLSAAGRRQVAAIQSSIEQVTQTVMRLRELVGPPPADGSQEFDPNRMLRETLELTRSRWYELPQKRGIVVAVQCDLDPELPAVAGRAEELREAVTHLICNAVDAMPHGGVLSVRSRAPSPGSDPQWVQLEIGDRGTGMDASTRARCLEPFFTTKGGHGSGLGLTAVQVLLARYDGRLQIDSQPGAGTTVRVSLPLPHDSVSRAGAPPGAVAARRPHLLLIDDDPAVLESLRVTLAAEGHRIEAACGGRAGLEMFGQALGRGDGFDPVITDLGMPDLDGRQVAAALRAQQPKLALILLTGWSERVVAESEVPVDRVLPKPPPLRQLRAALTELLGAERAIAPVPAAARGSA